MFFKKIIVLHVLFVGLLSFGNFAGDIEVKNFGGLAGVWKGKPRIVRNHHARQACMTCRQLKIRCEKSPQDEKCKKCKNNNKNCIFRKASKSKGSQEVMSVEIYPAKAAHSEPQETNNSYPKPYPAEWLDESIYFPNLNGCFPSEDH